MEYEFQQHVKEEDYIAFFTNHLFKSFTKPFNLVMFSVFFLYMLISPLITGDFILMLFALGFVVFMTGTFFYLRRSAHKIYNRDPEAFDMKYEMNESGLTFITTDGKITKLWGEFVSIKEAKDYVYLYVASNRGLIFVKRDIPRDAMSFLIRESSKNMKSRKVKLLK